MDNCRVWRVVFEPRLSGSQVTVLETNRTVGLELLEGHFI